MTKKGWHINYVENIRSKRSWLWKQMGVRWWISVFDNFSCAGLLLLIHEPIHQPIVRRNRTSTADIIQENNGGDYLSMIYKQEGSVGVPIKNDETFISGIYFSTNCY